MRREKNKNNTQCVHNNRISHQTVINRLKEFGLRARRPYVGPWLRAARRRNRLNWAKMHSRRNGDYGNGELCCLATSHASSCAALMAEREYTEEEVNGCQTLASSKGTDMVVDPSWYWVELHMADAHHSW